MNTKKILSWFALLGGEAIIIAAFILAKGCLTNNILVLNIVVTSVIYGLLFIDILVPWIDLNDKSQRKVGSIGLRWFFSWLYAISAIAVMLIANAVFEWPFYLQLLTHCILLFFLILGFIAILHSEDKVSQVYKQESFNRSGINKIKAAMQNLKDKMNDTTDLPEDFINRINSLEENLRFISPANNEEAHRLEDSFTKIVSDISFSISNFQMNKEAIESNLKKSERIYQNRKNIYSH